MDFDETYQSTAMMDWTCLQQLAPSSFIKIDVFNAQTVGMGCTRYTSHELWTQCVTTHHHTEAVD